MFKKIFNKPLFKELIIFSIILYLLDKIAWHYQLYIPEIGGEYDSFVHFVGGFSVTIGSLWLYFYSGIFEPSNRKYSNFFRIAITGILFIGFSWETYELIAGTMVVSDPGYVYDTTLDLTFDTLGSIVACIYAFNNERKLILASIINYNYGN